MIPELLTREDLLHFKTELLQEINQLFAPNTRKDPRLLKSREVMQIMRISRGTLLHLRLKGGLPYQRFGRSIRYEYKDIVKAMRKKPR